MARYAVLDGGVVVEEREIADWETYPQHKKDALDERGDGGPTLRPLVIEGAGPDKTVVVEPTQVRYVWHWNETTEQAKARLKRMVDERAEARRLVYITPGAGMAMTYDEKHAQARAVIALGETAANALTEAERADQFPVLAASVGIEAATLWECAQLVIARYEAFADIAGAIERTRLMGKKAISDASDAAAARAAYEAITWTV